MSLLPLFQLMNLYVMFSCPCNIKRFITINLNSYTAFNYVRAWPKIFHAETIKFQDLSWNFSFQAVIGRNIFEQDAQRPKWDATTSGGIFWLSEQTKYNCVCILTTRLPLTMQRQKWDPALARWFIIQMSCGSVCDKLYVSLKKKVNS